MLYTFLYYDSKLSLSCNLDKDLSKSRGDNPLVKHKNTRLYLQLYIPIDHEEYIKCSGGKQWEKNEEVSSTI